MIEALAKKLRLEHVDNLYLINQPKYVINRKGHLIQHISELDKPCKYLLVFVSTIDEFKTLIDDVVKQQVIANNGYLFVAYPKRMNTLGISGIHRDDLFPSLEVDEEGFVNGCDLKFNRMVGFDKNYTVVGLKRTTEQSKKQTKVDMDIFLPKLEKELNNYPQAYSFFSTLTPGYKKSWVQYVYAAKQEKTQQNRMDKMRICLESECKSIDLYRKRKSTL